MNSNGISPNAVRISKEAVALIIEAAVLEVEGVYSLKKNKLPMRVFNCLFRFNNPSAIEIIDRGREIDVIVSIVVKSSLIIDKVYSSKQIAKQVQEKIRADVSKMTDLIISNVEVRIESVNT